MKYIVRWQPKGEATVTEQEFSSQEAAQSFAENLQSDVGWELAPSVRAETQVQEAK